MCILRLIVDYWTVTHARVVPLTTPDDRRDCVNEERCGDFDVFGNR
jgi:hypothetical protein